MTLAQRVIVMNQGHAEQIGTPVEVYEKPATLFVASFIGSPAMNLLRGRLSADGSDVRGGRGRPRACRWPALPASAARWRRAPSGCSACGPSI